MRYGSLCSGIGGLDLAVEAVFGATPAWFCEHEAAPASILARHWPDVPILPDLKTQDWTDCEPIELLCAGYPCQPFSHAGRRQGATDPRHLWPFVLDAIRVLRPRLVVLENVSGHLGLGFDTVLGDLAEAGFDADWCVVPASAAGACHRRERLFVLAHAQRPDGWPAAGVGTASRQHMGQAGRVEGPVAPTGNRAAAPDASGERHGRGQDGRAVGRVDRGDAGEARQRQRARPFAGDRNATPPAHADDKRCEGAESVARRDDCGSGTRPAAPDPDDLRRERGGAHGDGGRDLRTAVADAHGGRRVERDEGQRIVPVADPSGTVAWGDYRPAIERWERVLGRPAPAPTDHKGRLSVDFVEWMQGFDEGWVDGLTRTAALKCLGNAVVQQQGILALSDLAGA